MKRLTNTCQQAVDSFKIRRLTDIARRLRELLIESDRHYHLFCTQLCSMRDTLDHKKSEFSAFAPKYYHLTSDRHPLPSDTDYELYPKGGGKVLVTMECFPFKAKDITRATVTALFPDPVAIAVVHIVLSLNQCGSVHHSFRHLIFA